MKINKLLLIAAALVLSFAVLTACGGETTTGDKGTPLEVDSRLEGYEIAPIYGVVKVQGQGWRGDSKIITSTQELYDVAPSENLVNENLTKKYDEEFFKNKVLLMAKFMHTSGSDRIHNVLGVVVIDNKLCPVIENGYIGNGTMDVIYTVLLIELDKDYAKKEPGTVLNINKYRDGEGTFERKDKVKIFENIKLRENNSLKEEQFGAYWVKSLDEYKALGVGSMYDASFFEEKALFVAVVEWGNYDTDRCLSAFPRIEGNTIYPTIITYTFDGKATGDAIQVTVMTAEVDKEYTNFEIAEIEFLTEQVDR